MKAKKFLSAILAGVMLLMTASFTVFAADPDIYEVNSETTFASVIQNAKDTNGDGVITYAISGKASIAGGSIVTDSTVTTINIVGKTADAELHISGNNAGAYIMVPNLHVNVSDMTLTKVVGNYIGDAGYRNRFFSISHGDTVTYKNCKFPLGACASTNSGTTRLTTFDTCVFSATDYYSLWVYDGNVDIKNCTFDGVRGIKVYAEDETYPIITKIEGTKFVGLTQKPAIVSTQPGKIAVTNSTFTDCTYGVLANESYNGSLAEVTIDGKTPEYVATVNGALYTNMEYAKAEADEANAEVKVPVAKIGNKYYTSLDEALADAEASGATETTIGLLQDVTKTTKFNGKVANLTIDLNGKTLYIAASDNYAKGYLKFMNGTVDITGVVTEGDSIFHMLGGADILFENAKLVGENFVSAFAVINLASVGSDATFTNSTVALKDELSTNGGFVKSGSTVDNIVTFDNTDVSLTNLLKAFVNNDIRIENGSDVTVIGGEYGFNVPKLTVSDSKLYVSGSLEPGIKVGNNPIIISGDSDVYVENIAHREATNTGAIEVKDTASLVAETISSALLTGMTVADTATVVSKADKISVEFVEVEDDTDEYLDNALWNIVLKGANAETINRLNSAELTFALADGEGDMAYEIIESNSQIDINPVNNSKDHYEFHFKGKEGVVDTANEIVIGQVAFEGYGDVDFSVDANGTNVVHATTISDNIVDTFRPGTSTTAKVGILDISAVIDSAIETVKENLEIHIAFPNAVNKNAYTYQDMTVTVENDDLGQLYVVKLGENNAANITATPVAEAAGIACTVDSDGCYVVTFTDILVQHNSYEITVEGAGYRTARYTVRMTEDKTVNFWNNVKDADAYMEVSKSESVAPAKLNYLAGDIVKDNKINVYDLSAVVSYFGEAGLSATKNPEYAKYDLNRDGFIDSKDVAIVLVSWGK
ncbi:MAG: hypothetical protein IJC78_03975 [Clostridia bacterium]|nr:hypothetical protein [Clostridia bacterium]